MVLFGGFDFCYHCWPVCRMETGTPPGYDSMSVRFWMIADIWFELKSPNAPSKKKKKELEGYKGKDRGREGQ